MKLGNSNDIMPFKMWFGIRKVVLVSHEISQLQWRYAYRYIFAVNNNQIATKKMGNLADVARHWLAVETWLLSMNWK